MTKFQSVKNVLAGLGLILCGLAICLLPSYGYLIVLLVISVTAVVKGIGSLIYFFSMARHMVGGRMILYKGIILLDLGIYTGTLTDVNKAYVLFYLSLLMLFSGTVDVLQAFESKKLEAPAWKYKMAEGLTHILIPIISLLFADSTEIVVLAYMVGLIYSGVLKIIAAFQKTAVIEVPE